MYVYVARQRQSHVVRLQDHRKRQCLSAKRRLRQPLTLLITQVPKDITQLRVHDFI